MTSDSHFPPAPSRRAFVSSLAAGLVTLSAFPAFAAKKTAPLPPAIPLRDEPEYRSLSFLNLHTGERLSRVYWEKGAYVSGALNDINRVLRDHRTGDIHTIDPSLLDLLHTLRTDLETHEPFQVISGYRSPHTNAMLNARSKGVAKRSLHMDGMAIDISLRNRSLAAVRNAARSLQRGGVGFYPQSGFVHIDTGRVRSW
ncbi:DUF882 domain-containing protein [Phaeovibrio sulfidiphilus]|uniref:Murein endopeptidase K n=1 Tax=Phaeovibrio sulfidiphilus TaxID=1220600 RepID=A0A8J6YI25_9PROT|nr:DUF882 domain-containing protein [Phaeovibrio sulfidiphilus]MBE1236621.1 DUF882 domain-containing protein [Phaeovibrio sulfidiphilus]